MFASRYFADRYFAPRYFPKVGAAAFVGAGTLAGFLAATAREEIILCELEPGYTLSGFTAVGGGTPNAYSISLPRFVQTTQVKGGMYAKTLRVAQDGVAL